MPNDATSTATKCIEAKHVDVMCTLSAPLAKPMWGHLASLQINL